MKKKAQEIAVIPDAEVVEYKTQISLTQKTAQALAITDLSGMQKGADILYMIKKAEDAIRMRKEEITRPLMKALSSARDLFKPLETDLNSAKILIRDKMLVFQDAEEERIEAEKGKIAGKLDAGKLKGETAIKKLENLGETPTSASGQMGRVTTRTIVKVRVIDEAAVPREYMMPNLPKITEAVLRQNAEIPGVERYEDKIIVGN